MRFQGHHIEADCTKISSIDQTVMFNVHVIKMLTFYQKLTISLGLVTKSQKYINSRSYESHLV